MKVLAARALAALFTGLVATALYAAPVTFWGISGTHSASVTFSVSGGSLFVTLTNTSLADSLVPTDLLTGVFFNVAGNPALGRGSGLLAGTSTVVYGPAPAGGVIGGEYAYLNALSQYGANSGISSSGLGIFGGGDLFIGPDLAGPPSGSPDGPQYGLLSAGDNSGTGNAGLTGSGGLIRNSVILQLTGFAGTEADISNVTFQYGTALDEGHFSGCSDCGPPQFFTPEPQTVALLGLGLLALAFVRRQRSA